MKYYAKTTIGEKTELVEITDDLVYRDKVIDELATISLGACPFYNGIMNSKDEDKDTPIISMPHLFVNSEVSDYISNIIEIKEEEFQNLMTPLILKHFKIKLKKKQWLFYAESYKLSKKDLKNGIAIHQLIQIFD